MPRTVKTKHTINLPIEQFLELRLDPEYLQFKAGVANQEISIPRSTTSTDAEGNGTIARSVEIQFLENPVPPFLRGLVDSLLGEELHLSLDEHAFARRCSYGRPTQLVHHFPKAIDEILSIESKEWLQPVSNTKCMLHTEHAVACTLFGMSSSIESAVEKGIREGYGKSPQLVDDFLRQRGGAPSAHAPTATLTPMPTPVAATSAADVAPITFADAMLHPAAALARAMGGLSCAASRKPPRLPPVVCRSASGGEERACETTRRISVTVEEAPPTVGDGGGSNDDASSVAPRRRMVSLVTSDELPSPSGRTGTHQGCRPRTISWNVSEDARGGRTVSMSVMQERGSWPCAPHLQSCVRAAVGCAC